MTTTHDTTSSIAPEDYALRWVDPRSLVDNPANHRSEQDRERLADSITELGVLEPPLVYEMEDGRLGIIAGECRKYSTIAAGQDIIPVYVRNDLAPAQRLAGILVENRQREPLRPSVEAGIVQQLSDMEGMKEASVAKMTGIKRTELRTLLRVSGSEVATAIGERHDLSLAHLAVLAEFDHDTEAVKQLTVVAVKNPARFDHLVAQLRRERDDRAAYEAMAKAITDAGVRLVELDSGSWLPGDAAWLDYLPAPKGRKTFTEAAHRSCPGHAGAVVETADGYEVAYLCLDPVGSGHVSTAQEVEPSGTVGGEMAKPSGMSDEQKAERKRVITNNKAWETATPVRLAYLAELLARRTPSKGTLRYVAEAVMANPRTLGEGDDATLALVLGKKPSGSGWEHTTARALVADATDARLPLVLLAQVAASVESQYGERQGWRQATSALAGYLRFLATCGYGLSEVERGVAGVPEDGDEPEGA